MFTGMFANNTYPAMWNQYVNFLLRGQEIVSKLSMGVLQFYGVATSDDIARLNRQLYEAYNRIDELEDKIDDLEKVKK
jgi:predicted  nucleic acid-binding Zn-ribbon protein